jgi:hypothetical protein
MKATIELEDGKYLRHILGIDWEQWNEMLFNVGMSFLEKWFPDDWLDKAQHTNFWDLWTMHFVRDDIIIKQRLLHMVNTTQGYENMKKAMLCDRALVDLIEQHLKEKR